MIKNEDTYYIGYHKNVRELGALPAVAFDTIAGLLRPNGGIGDIANSTLCDLLGISDKGLRKIIAKLIECGYLDRVQGNGRTNKTTYALTKKGEQSSVFLVEKGGTKFPKRGNKVPKKGEQNSPINTELNKELKESGGDTRDARDPHALSTTPQNFENMEDFNLFWELYPGDPQWTAEKENCERVWFGMRQEWRDRLIQQLRNGQRWRVRENDNPLWYLRNYNGEVVKGELPYLRQGTAQFTKWRDDNVQNGIRMCLIRFEDHVAYCLASDLPVMIDAGAKLLNGDWK